MSIRILAFNLFILVLFSCEFLQKNAKTDLKKELLDTVINYNKVDVLPSFPDCDSILSKDKKNLCFKENLYEHFYNYMILHTFQVSNTINETVKVKLMINKKGESKLLSIVSSEIVKEQIPMLEGLIKESVQKLPKILPATKRGVSVSTVYEIPIIVKSD